MLAFIYLSHQLESKDINNVTSNDSRRVSSFMRNIVNKCFFSFPLLTFFSRGFSKYVSTLNEENTELIICIVPLTIFLSKYRN